MHAECVLCPYPSAGNEIGHDVTSVQCGTWCTHNGGKGDETAPRSYAYELPCMAHDNPFFFKGLDKLNIVWKTNTCRVFLEEKKRDMSSRSILVYFFDVKILKRVE